MSAIPSLGGLRAPPSASGDAFAEITSGEFLQIIFTELQAQDPLEPQDTQAILNQLGSLREIESNLKLQQNLERLVDQNGFAAASGLIGNLVSGISLDNRRVADLVISVSNTADGPVLNLLDGSRVHIDMVDEVVGPLDFGEVDDDDNVPDDGDPGDDDQSVDDLPRDEPTPNPKGVDRTKLDTTGATLPVGNEPPIDLTPTRTKGIDSTGMSRLDAMIQDYRRGFAP